MRVTACSISTSDAVPNRMSGGSGLRKRIPRIRSSSRLRWRLWFSGEVVFGTPGKSASEDDSEVVVFESSSEADLPESSCRGSLSSTSSRTTWGGAFLSSVFVLMLCQQHVSYNNLRCVNNMCRTTQISAASTCVVHVSYNNLRQHVSSNNLRCVNMCRTTTSAVSTTRVVQQPPETISLRD